MQKPQRPPNKTSTGPSGRRRPIVTSVGSFVPTLTRKAFEKYGFSTAALLTDWAQIVGPHLASFTVPERLRWPKGVETFGETDEAARGRPGATLVLRVDGANVLEVQYQRTQVIDRINAYFGYRAVAELRFVQAPIARSQASTSPRPRDIVRTPSATSKLQAATASLDHTTDPALAAALARLGASIAADK